MAGAALLTLYGCKEGFPIKTKAPTPTPAITAAATPTTGPNPVGIYIPVEGSKNRKLLTSFSGSWIRGKDIDCFEAIASNQTQLTGSSFKSIWETAWKAFPDASGYKIGYRLTFTLKNGTTVTKTIKSPSDIAASFTQYVEVYLYDDIHFVPGVRYTHLSPNDIKDTTVITSIKLTAGTKIADVTSINLMTFIYHGTQDFDSAGNYTGRVSYEINITKTP
jgi:hypothetical protein